MCDIIAGELLVCFRRTDPIAAKLIKDIQDGKLDHVRILEDLDTRVSRAGLAIRPRLKFSFYRLSVPIGQEIFKINYLQFFYKTALVEALAHRELDVVKHHDVLYRSNYHLLVVPNSVLSVASEGNGGSDIGFSFTPTHDYYKQLFGWKEEIDTPNGKRVLVLDTGIDKTVSLNVVEEANFVVDARHTDATDDNGHGTAVASIIQNLCPETDLVIYKVADSNGRASEWDTLAALAAQSTSDLVNISLAFGLEKMDCLSCGRESQSSRSAVFENMIDQLEQDKDGPLIVAAAGNNNRRELSFPARFTNVVALESVNSALEISDFSNRSTVDQVGNSHQNVFVLPGGEMGQPSEPMEYIGTSGNGKKYYGTSFSTAYASGIIGALWSQPKHQGKDRVQLLNYLRKNSNKELPGFCPTTHGNGLMVFA